ncbi:universal stress protein [Marivivens donghaensis]|uniref:Universal stress protein n=1 Tax=Marivivens donghaensis TaxID=1699413 RepID=A0ABX0W0T7_9RHOB|nr:MULTISPECIES: universal stress protein [Marivivens]NIY72819.1 universal stress protein [Marivivens donghaensis]
MSTTLIAFVDGSEYAESVCRHAGWIAGRSGADVKVYHVMGRREAVAQSDLSGAIRLGARTALLDQLSQLDAERSKLAHEVGRAILEDAANIIRESGVEVSTRLRQGDLLDTLTAKEDQGDIIIIGKRGEAAGLASDHLGSNLERVVRASHKPVFVANRAFKPIQKVLIAFDNGANALKAVDMFARNSAFAGQEVHLVHVGKQSSEMDTALERAKATLAAGGYDAQIDYRDGSASDVLSEMTAKEGYDLLVMGAYSHSRVRSLFLGSHTTEMVRACKVPVFLVR